MPLASRQGILAAAVVAAMRMEGVAGSHPPYLPLGDPVGRQFRAHPAHEEEPAVAPGHASRAGESPWVKRPRLTPAPPPPSLLVELGSQPGSMGPPDLRVVDEARATEEDTAWGQCGNPGGRARGLPQAEAEAAGMRPYATPAVPRWDCLGRP